MPADVSDVVCTVNSQNTSWISPRLHTGQPRSLMMLSCPGCQWPRLADSGPCLILHYQDGLELQSGLSS